MSIIAPDIYAPPISIIIAKIMFMTQFIIAYAIANFLASIESIAVKPFSSLKFKTTPLPFFPKIL